MNKFGKSSKERLENLHPDLHTLCHDVILHLDISILCTYRDKHDQEKSFFAGNSKAQWGESPHNFPQAFAVDVALWNNGIDYEDKDAFKKIRDCFELHAKARGIELVFGYDWGWDMPHIELKKWRNMV